MLSTAIRRSIPTMPTTHLRLMSTTSGGIVGRTRIERLIEEQGAILVPGVQDSLTASIVQQNGFSAGFVSGYSVSASLLGKPDFGLLTTTEVTEVTRNVCNAAPRLPIITDADTGGGNALNVQRFVKDLIAAGAAGCFLEDQVWPKRCGHMRGKQVVPAEEHAIKIAAAREAIGDADFFLVARTDARATHDLEEAISRANLYKEAGADGIFVEAPKDDEELKEIGRRVKGYLVANMIEGGKTPLHTPGELKEMGFQFILYPLTAVYASARAVDNVMKILKEKGTTRDDLDKIATFSEFNKLINLDSWYELDSKFKSAASKS